MNDYNFEKWLAGHAPRKSMMEKLERSLIPYELFASMPLNNDKRSLNGSIQYGSNTYAYTWSYDYSNFGNDIYDVNIVAVELNDCWQNQVPGYTRFKVVMQGNTIRTIYADREDFFHKVIEMFEHEDMVGLYAHRNAYETNLLARYILLCLIDKHMPNTQKIATITSDRYGNLLVMAANANRTELILYAFSKREAIEMAKRYDGISRRLTVVYFLNQDFEQDGNGVTFVSDNTRVESIRSFCGSLKLSRAEQCRVERQILVLVSLLYNERLDWNAEIITQIATNPPSNATKAPRTKTKKKPAVTNPAKVQFHRTLLEDALNVLDQTPQTHLDIFHALCAANLVNAYINFCNRRVFTPQNNLSRMFMAKQQMLQIVLSLNTNPDVSVKVSPTDWAVFVHIRIQQTDYQFSFRGFNAAQRLQLQTAAIPTDGTYRGLSLQSIAPTLYQYSYLLRWQKQTSS